MKDELKSVQLCVTSIDKATHTITFKRCVEKPLVDSYYHEIRNMELSGSVRLASTLLLDIKWPYAIYTTELKLATYSDQMELIARCADE